MLWSSSVVVVVGVGRKAGTRGRVLYLLKTMNYLLSLRLPSRYDAASEPENWCLVFEAQLQVVALLSPKEVEATALRHVRRIELNVRDE